MSKETKQKLKDAPGSTMEELYQRGEVGEFDHLKELNDYKMKEDTDANSK